MKRAMRILSLLLVMTMLLGMAACGVQPQPTEMPTQAPTEPAPTEYTEPIPEGHNQVTFYWTYDGSYENCDIWIWQPDKAGKGHLFHPY